MRARMRFLSKALTVLLAFLCAHNALGALSEALPSGPLTQDEVRAEIATKLGRVQVFLQQHHLAGILLSRVNNFSWMTAGAGDNAIVLTSEIGAASLLITADSHKYIVGETGEVSRHVNEDLAGLGFDPVEYKWYEDQGSPDLKLEAIHRLAHGQPVGSDVEYGDLAMVGDEFASLRFQLTETEIKKYRWVARSTSEAVIAVCRRLHPGQSEREIETMASEELMRRGLRPTVLLMGVDHRVSDYYHHTPTNLRLKQYAIVNVCARRWGLVVSVARFVHFGPLDADLKRRLNAAMKISAEYQANSKPGITAGQMIEMAKRWFADEGFSGDWEMHHQGGAIGYAEREWIALRVPDGKSSITRHLPGILSSMVPCPLIPSSFMATISRI